MYVQTDKENLPQSIDVHRTKPLAMHHIATIQQQPTEQHKKKLRTEFGLHERDNPLYELPVDLYRCVHACILNTIKMLLYDLNPYRSTPVECLHTILLGPYKYLLNDLMDQLSPAQKKEFAARVSEFNTSGLPAKLSKSICRYYKSFHGHDFKLFAQMALFIVWEYLDEVQQKVWLTLSNVC